MTNCCCVLLKTTALAILNQKDFHFEGRKWNELFKFQNLWNEFGHNWMTNRPTNFQKYKILKGPRAFRSVRYVYLMNKTEII